MQLRETWSEDMNFKMRDADQEDKRPGPGQQSAYWCQYLRNFQHQRLKDRALTTIIKDISLYKEPLQVLLTNVQGGRRAFKQQCLKGEISYIVFPTLVDIGEADLAFNVVLSHSMWKDVVELCASEGVTRKSRDCAVKKAVQQCRWEEIMQMVEKAPSPNAFELKGQRVFQEMVRWGKLPQAVQILGKGVSVTDGDLNFAIRACLRLEQLDCAFEFVNRMESLDRNRSLLAQVVKASIPAGKLGSFLEVISKKSASLVLNTRFLKTLFKVLFRLQQSELVTKFCQAQEEMLIWVFFDIWAIANEAAIETHQWHAVNRDRLSHKEFGMCLKSCFKLKKRAERRKVFQLLEDWCSQEDNFDALGVFSTQMSLLSREIKPILLNTRSRWLGWCSAWGFCNLGFVLSLAEGNPKKLTRYLEQHGSSVKKFLLTECLDLEIVYVSNSIGEVLRHLSTDDVELCFLCENFDAETLIEACAEKRLKGWTVLLAIYIDDWKRVESEINEPDGIPLSLVGHVIVRASEEDEWQIVKILMRKHSLSSSVLFEVLITAISTEDMENAVDVAREILQQVDPKLAGHYCYRTLLLAAVQSSSDREQMVRLCISTGVSTFEARCSSSLLFGKDTAMSTALRNGQLPLVKLLYMSGATTNEELHRLSCDQSLKTRLSGQGRDDIVHYLHAVASSPRSLQDLCRLRVSHLIGCHPGRDKRLELLPLPSVVKDLVRFK